MSAFTRIAAAWRNLASRKRRDRDLDAELESYLELSADEHRRDGVSAKVADRLARIEMGSVASTSQAVREQRAGAGADRFWQDTRYALRGLRRAPGFAAAAIVILSLGIGANAVMFSVADAALFKPLPYVHPEELVNVGYELGAGTPQVTTFVGSDWRQIDFWRAQPGLFSQVLAFGRPVPAQVSGVVTSGPTLVGRVTPELIAALGIRPIRGRSFGAADAGQPVALVGEAFWKRGLQHDTNVFGRTLVLDDRPYTIVGVMPATFSAIVGGPTTMAWLPFAESESRARPGPGGGTSTIMRLRSGLTIAEAQRLATAAVNGDPAFDYGGTRPGLPGVHAFPAIELMPADGRATSPASTRSSMRILLCVVGAVLLIACANVANLLLGRAIARRRELAVRAALGASRGRLIRQMLTEGIVLAALGGAGALVVAGVAVEWVPRLVPWQMGLFNSNPMTLDARVLLLCAGAIFATALLCSLWPALRASRADVLDALEGSGRVAGVSRRGLRSRALLQIVEVALTLVLLTGTALFGSSFLRMIRLAPGYDLDGLISAGVSLPTARYPAGTQQEFFDRLLGLVQQMPHVEAATYGSVPPNGSSGRFFLEGHDNDPIDAAPSWTYLTIEPDYFRVMGIPLVQGRRFASDDVPGSDLVAIIDAPTAARYWPDQPALGKHIRLGSGARPYTVVGLAAAVKTRWFTSPNGTAEFYVPRSQDRNQSYRSLVVRTSADPAATMSELRAVVASLDSQIATGLKPQLVSEFYDDTFRSPRFYLSLMAIFAALALATAAVGLFALLNYTVAQRTREIGVRLALGADIARVRALVVRDALVPVGTGIVAGLIGAFWLTRYLASELFGVTAHDAGSYAAAVAAMLLVAGVAAFLPARRATRINPVETLRE